MSWKVSKISRYSTLGTISDYVDDVNGFLIRVGYRDPKTGEIIRDTKFTSFINNLRPWFGRIKIGYYFTSQAIDADEAVEEAEFVLNEISDYPVDFPVFFDVDLGNIAKGGRADYIDKEIRTQIYKAFSDAIGEDIGSGFIIDYSMINTLLDIYQADEIGVSIIRKHATYMPEIPDFTMDGWETAEDDGLLPGTDNVSPIIVYNDIAHWEETSSDIGDHINELECYEFQYTGKEIKPNVLNPEGLVLGIDYNIYYKNNVNVCDVLVNPKYMPLVVVYGLNSYSGTIEIPFYITPAPLKGKVTVTPASAQYTGRPIRPFVQVQGLDYNVDYIVQFQENVNVGNYTITVIGRKNHNGKLYAKFNIDPLRIEPDMFDIEKDYDYRKYEDDGRFEYGDVTDSTYVPNPKLIDYDGEEIETAKQVYDYEFDALCNVPTYSDEELYKGKLTFKRTGYPILPKVSVKNGLVGDEWGDLDDGTFDYGDVGDPKYQPDNDLVDYDGGEESGDPDDPDRVKFLGDYDFNNTLSNWSVEYGENTEIGLDAGSIKITGINNFTGEFTIYFDIVDDNFDGEFYLDQYEFEYDEKEHRPTVYSLGGGLPDEGFFNYTEEYYEEELKGNDDGRFDYGEMNNGYYPLSPDLVDFDGGEYGRFILYEDDGRFDYGDITDPDYEPADILENYEGGDVGEFIPVIYNGDFDFVYFATIPYDGNDNVTENHTVTETEDTDEDVNEEDLYDFNEMCPQEELVTPVIDIDGGEYYDESTYIDDGRFDYCDETEHQQPVADLVDFDGNEDYLVDYDMETMIDDDNIYTDEYDFNDISVLHEGENYTVEYINNIAVGTAIARVRGLFPFTAVTDLYFHINRVDINNPCYEFTLEYYSHKYLASIIEPRVYWTKDQTAIGEDPTFDVTYQDNVEMGTASVIITGTGNFTGTKIIHFIIVAGDLSSDCICRCGEPDEDGLYDFHQFEVYDTRLDRVLVPYQDYYFDNDSHWQIFPYNYSYIRVYRKVTGYYNYTGELESIFPTKLPGIVPVVPKLYGVSVEIIFMNGGKIPGMVEDDPSNIDVVIPEKEEPDEPDEPSGHSDKWIPTEQLFPIEKRIDSDADPSLLRLYPPGTRIKLYKCPYYSSPENPYEEPDLLTGSFYIYNYHVVCERARLTYTMDQVDLPGRTAGWVDIDEIRINEGGSIYRVGDIIFCLKDMRRNSDGSGGLIASAGKFYYIVAIATQLEWNFGDENDHPKMTDLSNRDYDFNESADLYPEDDDDYVYDFGTAEAPKQGYTDYNFGDEREDPVGCQWDLDFNNIHDVEEVLPDDDDYAPIEDYSIIYISDTEYDDWDTDESVYDFQRMAGDDTYDKEAPDVGHGYIIGLSMRPNQTPIGWASTEMIRESTDEEARNYKNEQRIR